ncbi:MAG: NUDIX hydrolase [Lachnospiraceae bacterium]
MGEYKRLRQELAYKGKIVEFYRDYIQLPNGKEVEWDFVKHNGASAILPVNEDGNIVMVKQYRNSLDRMTLEIPAGGINPGELDPMAAAVRELEEETGYSAGEVHHLSSIVTAIGFSSEIVHLYWTKASKQKEQHLDEDENIEILTYSLDELIQMIMQGTIIDAKTITAIMMYQQVLKEQSQA